MESSRRNFFNEVENSDRRVSLIGWKKILASKKNCGLGVSSFFALNLTLFFKWIWRFISHGSSLWSRIIKAIHGVRWALDNSHTFSRRSPWLDIILGNGESTSFWYDVWLADSPLKYLYPRLYSLELDKHYSVVAKLWDSTLISSFKRTPRGGIEEEQLQLLVASTYSIVLPQSSDRWVWRLDSSGDFSVKSVCCFIDDSFLPKEEVPTR
ncbi:hypothetical protein Tco_0081949 [Tanacetum coccineum]